MGDTPAIRDSLGRRLHEPGSHRPPFKAEIDDSWRLGAACVGLDTLFFIERGHTGRSSHPARVVCAECPVIEPCLEYALTTKPLYGVWGGMTLEERKKYAQRRRREAS